MEGVVVVLRSVTSRAAAQWLTCYRSSSLPLWTPKYVQAPVLLYSNLYVIIILYEAGYRSIPHGSLMGQLYFHGSGQLYFHGSYHLNN